MIVAMKTGRRSAFKALRYVETGVLVVAALVAARDGWRIYMTSPWTGNGMARAQVANVAPQMSRQIVEASSHGRCALRHRKV
jgi:multidrug resistance efflux pump